MSFLIVAIGGGLGAVARYLTGLMIQNLFPSQRFPYASLTVNLTGSFGLGIFFALLFEGMNGNLSTEVSYLFLVVGFFGAFTTFSTFSVDAVYLYSNGQKIISISYVILTAAGSIMSLFAGIHLMQ